MWPAFRPQYAQPIQYESATYSSDEILCRGSDNEDLPSGHRERKRKRIEEKGNQYLAGRGHFILSAILKHPFDSNCNNPWASSGVGHYAADTGRQGPVKSGLPPYRPRGREREEFTAVELRSGGLLGGEEVLEEHHQRPVRLRENKRYRSMDPFSRPARNARPSAARSSPPRANDDWLRTRGTNKYRQPSRKSISPSPTPVRKERPDFKVGISPRHTRSRKGSLISVDWSKSVERASKKNTFRAGSMRREGSTKPSQQQIGALADNHTRGQVKTCSLSRHNVLQQRSPKPFLRHRKGSETDAGGQEKEAGRALYAGEGRETRIHNPGDMPPINAREETEGGVIRKQSAKHTLQPLPYEVATGHISVSSGSYSASSSDSEPHVAGTAAVVHSFITAQRPSLAVVIPYKRAKAISATARRLTFSPNGGSQVQDSRPSSRHTRGPDTKLSDNKGATSRSQKVKAPPNLESKTTKTSSKSFQKVLSNGARSKDSTNVLPEAQLQEDPPPVPGPTTRSSTNLIETDKQPPLPSPVYFEEDSYMNLATQAAMEKARRRFNDDILTKLPTRSPKKPTPGNSTRKRSPKAVVEPSFRTPLVERIPLSTQAMMDEMSPFDISTIKKRSPEPHGNPAKSPIEAPRLHAACSPKSMSFPTYLPNLPTSSSILEASPSKGPNSKAGVPDQDRSQLSVYASAQPSFQTHKSSVLFHGHPEPELEPSVPPRTLSPLTSFSIRPDGTLTETRLQQDGQQHDPVFIPGESYATLPSLDSTKPLGTATPLRSNGSPISANDRALTSTTPQKAHNLSYGNPDPSTPHNEKNDDSNAFFVHTSISDISANTQDRETHAFIEDAGSFLAEWNFEDDARRLKVANAAAARRATEKEKLGGEKGTGTQVKGILARKKGGRN